MADLELDLLGSPKDKVHTAVKCAVSGIGLMCTTLILEHLEDNLWTDQYGDRKEKFTFSLFPIFFTLLISAALSACILILTKGQLTPVSPVYTYCGAALSDIMAKSCMYGAVGYTSFAVRTLFSCMAMVSVMVWGVLIMQQKYKPQDYLFAVLVSVGSSVFILYPVAPVTGTYSVGREGTLFGVFLLTGYLICEGFASSYQDVLFRGYPMSISNQLLCISLFTVAMSFAGLILQNHLVPAVLFLVDNPQSFLDILLISLVGTASQFFSVYTIKTFGARTFSLILTLRQLVRILLSCVWSTQPLSWVQWVGAAIVVVAIWADNVYGSKESQPEIDPDQERNPEDGTPEDNTPEDKPEDGTPEDNTPEDNTPEDNTPEDDGPP